MGRPDAIPEIMGTRDARQKKNREMKRKTKKMERGDQDKKRVDKMRDKKNGETRRKRKKMGR